MYWLEVPVFGSFTFGDKILLYAGPYLGFYLSGSYSWGGPFGNDNGDIESDEVGNPDFGIIFGAGFNITRKISIDGRYSSGLLTLDPDGAGDFKNEVLQLLVGYDI